MMGFFKKMWGKAKAAARKMKSKFDCDGSYTGNPSEPRQDRRPEQDADDL